MTEVGTIAGSASAPNGIKPLSPDENPGAPEMDRGVPTAVPGLQPRPAFGATDPAASTATPVAPATAADASPTPTAEISSSGADKAAQQDKDAEKAKADEAEKEQPKDAQTGGKSFADIKSEAQAGKQAQRGALIGANRGSGSLDQHGVGYAEPEPAVGRIVLYTLTQEDADRINTRRVYGPKGDDMSPLEEGAAVQAGVQYPAMITSVGDQVVNLQVFADGNHGVWIKDAKKASGGGGWAWPVIKR